MRIVSPAKINLSLSVGPVLDSGYHQLDSYFHLISLTDTLTLAQSQHFAFSSSVNLDIPDEENLVVKAVDEMVKLHHSISGGARPNIHLHLDKKIPHGAGLGGGSSNAAAAIYGLSQIWGLQPSDPRHLEIAGHLGSDVPLFLAPTTASIMTGTGATLKQSLPPIVDMNLVIVAPAGTHSPTSAVYKAFDDDPQPTHSLDLWENNLQKAAIEVSPKTGQVLEWLSAQTQVQLAQVSGSGCACWAQVQCRTDADHVVKAAQSRGYLAFKAHTLSRGIHIL